LVQLDKPLVIPVRNTPSFDMHVFLRYHIATLQMDIHKKNTILITCGLGLADYVAREVEQLGFDVQAKHQTGVAIVGSLDDAQRLNLCLRTAYNVLYLLREFRCKTADDLYRNTIAIRWEDIIPPNEYVSVVSRVDNPSINNSMFPNLKVKDAIVDRVLKKTSQRPNSGPDKNNIVIHLYWKNDRALLYVNTSGIKLSDRSYRKMPYKAPLRESLAAGIIMATDYNGDEPLVVPMCGSGTLAIEAALMATARAPGLLRTNYCFMHLNGFDNEKWKDLRVELRKQCNKIPPAKIIASDIDHGAIESAEKNAMTAGVEHLIEFHVCDFADTPVPDGAGIVLLNPEYGQRLGEQAELEETYKRIGDFFKQKCTGYTGYIFTGNMALAKKVGLRTSRRISFVWNHMFLWSIKPFDGIIKIKLTQQL